jgi:DMSO/TMAO reductase YedYZ heme-binding membrane subunit
MGMSEQPADESAPPRWSPGQVALVVAAAALAVVVGVTLLGQAGVLPDSGAAGISAAFLGVCGLTAGLIGATERRKERWPKAVMAYRVAMWCFFLAALHVVKYHVADEREATEERVRNALERNRLQHPDDTGRKP